MKFPVKILTWVPFWGDMFVFGGVLNMVRNWLSKTMENQQELMWNRAAAAKEEVRCDEEFPNKP